MKGQPLPKRILVDANFLVALVNPKLHEELRLRLNSLIEQIEEQRCTLIVPMPALAEYLVGADIAGLESINALERKTFVLMASFDRAAAFECANLDSAAIGRGDKRDGSEESWQKVKVDRQLIAIGKACGAQLVISQDKGVKTAALRSGMTCLTIADLPLPPEKAQRKLDLPDTTKKSKK